MKNILLGLIFDQRVDTEVWVAAILPMKMPTHRQTKKVTF